MIKILIAEDEIPALNALEKQLKSIAGGKAVIVPAANGAEAVRQSEKLVPDLAILDIEMPVLNGMDAAKIIRHMHTDCRIIFLTAYKNFDYALSAVRLSADDYLLKPVSTDTLKAKLFELFPELNDKKSDKAEPAGSFKFKAAFYIERHYAENFSLEQVAEVFRLNPFYFSRVFKEEFGQTFVEYLTAYRLQKADSLLSNSNLSIKEIARACGYADANYFAKVYKRAYLKSPSEKRKAKKITP